MGATGKLIANHVILIMFSKVHQRSALNVMLNPKFMRESSGCNVNLAILQRHGLRLNYRCTLYQSIMENEEIKPVRFVIKMSILNTPVIAVMTTNRI